MMLWRGRINSRKTPRLTDNEYILPLFFYISSFCISFLKIPLPIIFSYFDQAELSVVSPVRVASCNLLIATSSSSSHYSYFSPSSSPPPPSSFMNKDIFRFSFPKRLLAFFHAGREIIFSIASQSIFGPNAGQATYLRAFLQLPCRCGGGLWCLIYLSIFPIFPQRKSGEGGKAPEGGGRRKNSRSVHSEWEIQRSNYDIRS